MGTLVEVQYTAPAGVAHCTTKFCQVIWRVTDGRACSASVGDTHCIPGKRCSRAGWVLPGIEAGPQRDEMAALPYVCSPSEAVGHDAEDALSLEKL